MSAVLQEKFISVIPFSDEYAEQAMSCARLMHAESLVHRHMDFDSEKVLKQFRSTSPDMYFRIAVLNGEMLGGLLGINLTIYFGADKVAKDLAIFVKKEFRLSRAAFLLVRDFEDWAKERGASSLLLSQTTGLGIETTSRFYAMLGYEVMGVTAWKALK